MKIVSQIADSRTVCRNIGIAFLLNRVGQVIATACGDGFDIPILLDELDERDVITIFVGYVTALRELGYNDQRDAGTVAEEVDGLDKAGVVVEEARLTHLAYAPEIAQAMLRRQQAEAVIAARQKIVHGAVSMVDMALKELAEKQVVQLDDERRAAMVSNLMVVLCGEAEVHPVVNTGTLYA